jgi:hypothetical protein
MQIKKVKVFSEKSATDLEQAVNQWLAANPNVEVLEALQSESGDREEGKRVITFSIVYSTTQAS